MRRRFDLAPLSHPLWWGALALLLVNDHLLKGSGAVPGWLTGKLSDFAFLVVAPVVAAALIPRRFPGRRVLALSLVAGPFIAAKLHPGVSDAIVALLARVGLRWRLWPDATDLVALAVLPLTGGLLARTARSPDDRRSARRRAGIERAGVMAGALACVATSYVHRTPYDHTPFLLNRTGTAADVRITWVLREVDCYTGPEAVAATIAPSDLDDPLALTLTSGATASLSGPQWNGMSPVGVCETAKAPTSGGACVSAILEAPGATPVLVVARSSFPLEEPPACAPTLRDNEDLGRDAITLVQRNGALAFEVTAAADAPPGPVIGLAPVDLTVIAGRPAAPNGCRTTRDAYRALAQSTACAADTDCQALPAAPVPGEASLCTLFVNDSVSPDAIATLKMQWSAAKCLGGSALILCPPPLAAVCRAGACVEECAGVTLPTCPPSCGRYASYPGSVCNVIVEECDNGGCRGGHPACLDTDGQRCTCSGDAVTCAPIPLVDPSCPVGCRPGPPSL
jgi:hypothetical protein